MTQKPAADAKPAAEAAASDAPKKSPFHKMYPAQLAPAAESYFGEWNKVLFKTGPIESKTARLAAVAASAAMKCEYCITAQGRGEGSWRDRRRNQRCDSNRG